MGIASAGIRSGGIAQPGLGPCGVASSAGVYVPPPSEVAPSLKVVADIANLFTTNANTNPVVNPGDRVGRWKATIGGFDFDQADPLKRATFSNSAMNGNPAVLFNGVDQWLKYWDGSVGTAATGIPAVNVPQAEVIVVVRPLKLSIWTPLAFGNDTYDNRALIVGATGGGISGSLPLSVANKKKGNKSADAPAQQPAEPFAIYDGSLGVTSVSQLNTGGEPNGYACRTNDNSFNLDEPAIFGFRANGIGTSYAISRNNVDITPISYGAPNNRGLWVGNITWINEIEIGAAPQSNGTTVFYPFNGWIAEVRHYNRILTTPERDLIMSNLSAKYGIPIGPQASRVTASFTPTGTSLATSAYLKRAGNAVNCYKLNVSPVSGSTKFTAGCWFKLVYSTGDDYSIMGKRGLPFTDNTDNVWWLTITPDLYEVQLNIKNPVSGYSVYRWSLTDLRIPYEIYTRIDVTFDGDKSSYRARLFINGDEVLPSSTGPKVVSTFLNPLTAGSEFYIGRGAESNSYVNFSGEIFDAGVWDRVLPDAQILAITNNGVQLPIANYDQIGVADYISAWTCTEPQGQTRKDSNLANANDLVENIPIPNGLRPLPNTSFEMPQTLYDVIVTPGTPGPFIDKDANMVSNGGATYNETAIVGIREVLPGCTSGGVFSGVGPGTIDQQGKVTYAGDGLLEVTFTTPSGQAGLVDVYCSQINGNVDTFQNFVSNPQASLAYHCANMVDSRITGATPAANGKLFTTLDHANGIYVRNPAVWTSRTGNGAGGVSTSAAVVWNSIQNNSRMGGVLISPEHVAHAAHYAFGVGTLLKFVRTNNAVIQVTVIGVEFVPGTDIAIARISPAIDDTTQIRFSRVLPQGTFIPKLPGTKYGVPTVCLNQFKDAFINPVYGGGDMDQPGNELMYRYATSALRQPWSKEVVNGDSGSPTFLIIDPFMVLLGCWHLGGAGQTSDIASNHAGVNAAMTRLGGGQQLTDVNVTSWPIY